MREPNEASRGFTLIELMVSMAIGFLLVGGAFEMHAAFARQSLRQEHLVDMQQALRASRDLIAKSIRSAGAGLSGGALSVYDCNAGTTSSYFAVQFSNRNGFADPMPTDVNAGDTEQGDPDWLRTVALDPDSRVTLTQVQPNANVLTVTDATKIKPGDLLYVYNGDTSSDVTKHAVLGRQVTAVALANGGPSGTVTFCYAGTDQAMQKVNAPSPVYRSARWATFRIDNSDPASPKLMASYAPPKTPPVWRALSENIEDMQLAMVMNDGTVCGRAGNSVDAPSLCNPQGLRALRFTLVARSSSPVPGWDQGQAGGFEDELPAAARDGYLRRPLLGEVEIRNFLP